jgi:hypothetical protein
MLRCSTQTVAQTSTGTSIGTHNGVPAVSDVFSYPLSLEYDTLSSDGSSCESAVQ